MSPNTPILPCPSSSSIIITPTSPPSHPLQSPTFSIPPSLQPHLDTAASHLRAGRTVAFPTETVYGLGASSLNTEATRLIYKIKNRPSDNPLIMHVSSLDMLNRLLPPPDSYRPSRLYLALMSAFWPGPLTLLFPSPNPPPPPAPQTNAIRMPSHPLALALIHTADLPVSAPSANSSGRPSPTQAIHVYNDLNGAEGLGCILDGGDCGVGVESTVVNGLNWKEGGGGFVDVLRPGGLGVEEIARIVAEVDGQQGSTRILVHGKPWSPNAVASTSTAHLTPKPKIDLPPSTPGMKYRHYSPGVPVYLLLPSNIFSRPADLPREAETSARGLLRSLATRHGKAQRPLRFGLLHYDSSPISQRLLGSSTESGDLDVQLIPLSLGADATSAAQRLFGGMLKLEGRQLVNGVVSNDIAANGDSHTVASDRGVDAILIEGCTDEGLGLAVMERVGKAVGGGGVTGGLANGQVGAVRGSNGRFWVDVTR
ncbi:hypothetical protein JCM24511_03471 [Saitozyma sp. JCM 24511]|nr:hypothetical protein JCM24511_03471 [Saitozyma sp. JCM 24511]